MPALDTDHVSRVLYLRAAVRTERCPALAWPEVLLRDRWRRNVVIGVRCVRQVSATPEADQVLRLHLYAAVWAAQDSQLLVLQAMKPLPVTLPLNGRSALGNGVRRRSGGGKNAVTWLFHGVMGNSGLSRDGSAPPVSAAGPHAAAIAPVLGSRGTADRSALLYVCFVGLEGVVPATLTIRPIEEGRYRGRRRGLAVGPPPAWTTGTTGIATMPPPTEGDGVTPRGWIFVVPRSRARPIPGTAPLCRASMSWRIRLPAALVLGVAPPLPTGGQARHAVGTVAREAWQGREGCVGLCESSG